jgi:hypothetical protein
MAGLLELDLALKGHGSTEVGRRAAITLWIAEHVRRGGR